MNESDWFAASDPDAMLQFLGSIERLPVSVRSAERKFWLFTLACSAPIRHSLPVKQRQYIEAAEELSPYAVPITAELAADQAYEAASMTQDPVAERRRQAHLLRCIFGNPFRPLHLVQAKLSWNDGALCKIALAIYVERRFKSLPLLGDALEDAGIDNSDIISHCRDAREHVRGCWVIDLLLGKACEGRPG